MGPVPWEAREQAGAQRWEWFCSVFPSFLRIPGGGGLETGGQDKAEVVVKRVGAVGWGQILRCSALLEGWIAM